MEDESIIKNFHSMWDNFPGMANIIASNKRAEEMGFVAGCCCAKAGEPQIHKGCLTYKMFQTMESQLDCPSERKVRGWVPEQ